MLAYMAPDSAQTLAYIPLGEMRSYPGGKRVTSTQSLLPNMRDHFSVIFTCIASHQKL